MKKHVASYTKTFKKKKRGRGLNERILVERGYKPRVRRADSTLPQDRRKPSPAS